MKRFVSVLAIAALAGGAYGQLNPVPPIGGVPQQAPQAQWSSTDLQHYVFASDINLNTPSPTANGSSPVWTDNALGLQWGLTPPTLPPELIANGGNVRAILLGESAGWFNHFGYTVGAPDVAGNAYSLLNDIQYVNFEADFQYHYFDVPVLPGEAGDFDFWLSGVGNNPPASGQQGGFYSVFHNTDPDYNNPSQAPNSNVRWTLNALMIDTEVPDLVNGGTMIVPVETWLVGLEDYNLPNSDGDFNDFLFAVQFFNNDGTPFTPVPEPSTYGLIGAGVLLGFVAFRRFQAKRKAQASA